MNEKRATGALCPPDLKWQIGTTAAGIQFVNLLNSVKSDYDCEFILDHLINLIKNKDIILMKSLKLEDLGL